MMEFKTKQELYSYLNEFDFEPVRETPMSSVYFLVKYKDYIEPIYFTHFRDVWFPSPCSLSWFPIKDDDIGELVASLYYEKDLATAIEYERTMQRNGVHYEINCWQCEPFLPDEIEIIEVLGESQCLDWLLCNCKKQDNSTD